MPSIISVGAPLDYYFQIDKKKFMNEVKRVKMYSSSFENSYTNLQQAYHLFDHYVTITGLVRDEVKGRSMMIVSSWGSKYFVDINECYIYADKYNCHFFCDFISFGKK